MKNTVQVIDGICCKCPWGVISGDWIDWCNYYKKSTDNSKTYCKVRSIVIREDD